MCLAREASHERGTSGHDRQHPTPIAFGYEWERADKANLREIPTVTEAGTAIGDVGFGDGALGLVRAWNLPIRVRAGTDAAWTVKRPKHPFTRSPAPSQEEVAYGCTRYLW